MRRDVGEGQSPTGLLHRSSLRLLVVLAVATFVIEFSIMATVALLPRLSPWFESLVDSTLLVALLSPVLVLLVLRPLALQMARREQAEMALRTACEQLEQRVRERTADLERRNQEINLLAQASNLLQACVSTAEAYDVAARTAELILPGSSGALFMYNPSRDHLERRAAWGQLVSSLEPPVFSPDSCWALRRGRTHSVDDSCSGRLCGHECDTSQAPSMCIPMIAQGEVLGVVRIEPAAASAPAASGDESGISAVATALLEHIAMALTNLRLRESLRDQSIHDPLTGLFNRRYMEESLAREIRQAERRGQPLTVVMLDLDHFKRFNDRFGHQAGDLVLREVGALLSHHIRSGDIPCRYGGEEFALVLPDTGWEAVVAKVEALLAAIKGLHLRCDDRTLGRVASSAGIACFPEHGTTGVELLRSADHALYQAKTNGRDRAMVASAASAASGASAAQPAA